MHYGYRKNKKVVSMVVLKEADSKDVPTVDMDVVEAKDMA
jgi:hypothetical protein